MIEIRQEQYQSLATSARRDFDCRMIEHLREDMAEYVGGATDAELQPLIDRGIQRANRHGLETEFEVVCFIDAAVMLQDFEFDSRPEYSRILSDRKLTAEARAERIVELAAESGVE